MIFTLPAAVRFQRDHRSRIHNTVILRHTLGPLHSIRRFHNLGHKVSHLHKQVLLWGLPIWGWHSFFIHHQGNLAEHLAPCPPPAAAIVAIYAGRAVFAPTVYQAPKVFDLDLSVVPEFINPGVYFPALVRVFRHNQSSYMVSIT